MLNRTTPLRPRHSHCPFSGRPSHPQCQPRAGVATHEGIPLQRRRALLFPLFPTSHAASGSSVGLPGAGWFKAKCLLVLHVWDECGIDETEDWCLGYVMFVDGVCCSFPSRGLVLVLVFRGYMCGLVSIGATTCLSDSGRHPSRVFSISCARLRFSTCTETSPTE